jgi:hypothetical protein
MRSSEAARLALSLAGVLAITFAVLLLPGIVSVFLLQEQPLWVKVLGLVSYLIPVIVLMAAGIYLLRSSDRIARYHFAGSGEGSASIGMRDLEALAFSWLGLLIFLLAIPGLGKLAFGVLWIRRHPGGSGPVLANQLASYAGTLLQAIVGAYLFFYGPRFAGLWHRLLRHGPQPVSASPSCPRCSHPFDPAEYEAGRHIPCCSRCGQPLPAEAFEKESACT